VWRTFASATSNVPFAAILVGRQRLAIGEIGWWRLATAAVLFLRRNARPPMDRRDPGHPIDVHVIRRESHR